MKKNGNTVFFFIIITLLLSSCTKEIDENEVEPVSVQENIPNSAKDANLYFGRILANALHEVSELREFIKIEALKQFDNDYDVLVTKVLHQKTSTGNSSFYQILKEYDVDGKLDEIILSAPLMTIYVPKLSSFSPENWDTSNEEAPFVAVYDPASRNIKYFAKDLEFEEAKDLIPAFPVVVVKTNERSVVLGNGLHPDPFLKYGTNISNFSNLNIRFMDDVFDASKTVTNTRTTRIIDEKVENAYRKAQENDCVCPHRDFIYYDIFEPEGKNEGPFDSRYGEAITSLTFENVAGIQTATDNWTEGNLELHIQAFFIGGSSSLSSLKKVVNVPASEVQIITTERKCKKVGIWPFRREVCWDEVVDRQLKSYEFSDPVDLVTWRMDEYGSKIKYSITEYDPSTTYEKTISHETQKAANFKINASTGVKVKVGAEFGGSISQTTTATTKVTYTVGSEDLGEAVLDWTDPIVVRSRKRNFLGIPREYFYTYTVSTGSVILSCETVRK